MEKEKAHYETSSVERREKDRSFGKMIRNYKKSLNKPE